jgi:hypothetical protein
LVAAFAAFQLAPLVSSATGSAVQHTLLADQCTATTGHC